MEAVWREERIKEQFGYQSGDRLLEEVGERGSDVGRSKLRMSEVKGEMYSLDYEGCSRSKGREGILSFRCRSLMQVFGARFVMFSITFVSKPLIGVDHAGDFLSGGD